MRIGLNKINRLYQLKNYFNIRIYIIPIWFYFNWCVANDTHRFYVLYIPIWFYFNQIDAIKSDFITIFTFQYGSTLIRQALKLSEVN